jgi:hypothetical protein
LAQRGPYKVRNNSSKGPTTITCINEEGKQTSIHYKR